MPRNSTPSRSSAPALKPSYPLVRSEAPQANLGTIVKEGFGFGMGSAIAHRMVGAFFPTNGSTLPPHQPGRIEPCQTERRAFENCLINESEYFCHNQQDSLTACLKVHAKPEETK